MLSMTGGTLQPSLPSQLLVPLLTPPPHQPFTVRLLTLIAAATSLVTVPILGLGMRPLGPRI